MKTILILDDDKESLIIIANRLKSESVQVLTVNSSNIALEKLRTQKIDCIISDMKMPNKTGLEFLTFLRDNGIGVPLVFYTSNNDQRRMMKAAKYDAYDYVQKPDLERLSKVVERGLNDNFQLFPKVDENKVHVTTYYQELISKFDQIVADIDTA